MAVNITAAGTSGASIQSIPADSTASGSVAVADELVVERYKVEANFGSVQHAVAIIEACMGELQVAENRLRTGGAYLTNQELKAIESEVAKQESRIRTVKQDIFDAMEEWEGSPGHIGFGGRIHILRTGQSWSIGGLKPHTVYLSQLPVMPTIESIQLHGTLIDTYKGYISAAENTRSRYPHSELAGELMNQINWWRNEINATHASLGKVRDEGMGRYEQLKAPYDVMCLELSTIRDNGVQRSQARADELDKEISLLEASMKLEMAIIDEVNAIPAA